MRATPVKAVLRFVSATFIVSGILLLADAGVTLLWQEPVSAVLADLEQRELERDLASPPARVLRKEPLKGDAIGRLRLPSLKKTSYIVEGTDTESLRKGPGHYPETPLPGTRGTVAVAGHRTTYGAPFREIDQLKEGQPIILEMAYGTFEYRVQGTRIVEPTETSVKNRVSYDRLILSACHPLYSAAQRIVVFARFVRRGPPTVKD
jgi:sortase A